MSRLVDLMQDGKPPRPEPYLCLVKRQNTMSSSDRTRFRWEIVSFAPAGHWQTVRGYDYGDTEEVLGWIELPDAAEVAARGRDQG